MESDTDGVGEDKMAEEYEEYHRDAGNRLLHIGRDRKAK
jgi:hypothetical protein